MTSTRTVSPTRSGDPIIPHGSPENLDGQSSMLYFAYGSNMLTERLQARVSSAEPLTPARLPGRTLRFHKRSKDGSGKCNLVPASEDSAVAHGVLFDVAPDDLSALDEAEHRGHGYERCRVHPHTPDRSVEAFAYVAQPAYVDDALRPYDWYRAVVTAGAHQHDLPTAYCRHLESIRTYPDLDEERRAHYRSLLRAAGFLHLWPEK